MRIIPAAEVQRLRNALPFWLSLGMIPVAIAGAVWGGLWVVGLPIYSWGLFSVLDAISGLNEDNADLETPESGLNSYRAITLIWVPLQFVLLFWMIWYVPQAAHLGVLGKIVLFFGAGVVSGTIGITYAHELMHQKPVWERWLGDILLAMVMYSHFRSEHLRVHHLYVGTPRDAVTARYNEGFHRFYPRVLRSCYRSAWAAEAAMLARRGLGAWDKANPFWRYWGLQAGMILLALALGGWQGLALFFWQASVAIWQLELVNYVEHYGLTRRYLGEGRYEHVLPRHSWNASQRATNWLLINLQRHSDHHYKPDRRFPLLQTYSAEEAPQLPYGYSVMTVTAMIPPLWKRVMNPRVRAWRRKYYADISDWHAYNKALNPAPRGAPL
jgi:alkane 1-monooxygenase